MTFVLSIVSGKTSYGSTFCFLIVSTNLDIICTPVQQLLKPDPGCLELTAGRAYTGGKEVFLTPKEFALLRCLMQNKNLVMSREQLLVKCWGYDYEGESRAVDTHIKRLREKLGDYAECIKTVIKAGYRLEG